MLRLRGDAFPSITDTRRCIYNLTTTRTYEGIDDRGLHISFGAAGQLLRLLAVDNIVICAGQQPVRALEECLRRKGIDPHIIGGSRLAVELDAKRAIKQVTELGARL